MQKYSFYICSFDPCYKILLDFLIVEHCKDHLSYRAFIFLLVNVVLGTAMPSTVSITSWVDCRLLLLLLPSTKAIKHLGFAAAKIPKLKEQEKKVEAIRKILRYDK